MRDASVGAAGALLVLWNDVDPALDAAYNDWHSNEHVPERLTVPGIWWALRYARLDAVEAAAGTATPAPMPRYLTLYGLRDAQVLDGAAYRRLLEEPTETSRAMRPALRKLTRWVCSLDTLGGIERFERLAVRTVAAGAAPRSPRNVLPSADGALLVATRLPEAASLPWLAGGQSRSIDGDRLEGLAHDDASKPAAANWRGVTVYTRLPVAPTGRR